MGTTPLTDNGSAGISAIVHTRNSAATLEKTLRSLLWADEIIVVDMASADGTLEIARSLAQRVLSIPEYPRVDGIRNRYLEEAKHEWILVLDSDEYLAADAATALRGLIASVGMKFDAFALPRFNTIAGQIMPGGPWYPDHQIRLFRKNTVQWSDNTHALPEVITGRHRLCELTPPDCPHIHHLNYPSLQDFIRRQLDYALRDNYDADPRNFDFSAAISRAYEVLAFCEDRENGGDLSHALALVLAWDAIMRALIHWDRLDPKPPLGLLTALPVATGRVPWWEVKLRRWFWRRHSLRFALRRIAYILRGIAWKYGWRRKESGK